MGRRFPFLLLVILAAQAQVRRGFDQHATVNLDAIARQPRSRLASIPMPRPLDSAAHFPHFNTPGYAVEPSGLASGAAPDFDGFVALLDDYATTPPDSQGAVGPDQVLTMLNSGVFIQERSGRARANFPITLAQFWSGLGPFTKLYDPRILFDASRGRWIACAAANPWQSDAALLLAVSATSDAAGNWDFFAIHIGAAGDWADYPELGFNQTWIALSANLYTLPPSGNYAFTAVYAFDKSSVYEGKQPTYSIFTTNTGELAPATDLDNSSPNALYFLQTLSGSPTGGVRISTLSGPLGHETFIPGAATIALPDTWNDGPPGDVDFAPQNGSWVKIDTGDSRIQNCVFRLNAAWCAHTVFLPAGNPSRSSIEWFQLDPAASRILQRGLIDDPTSANFYAYPSIAVNRNNDALIGYTRFNAAAYPAAAYSFHPAAAGAGATQASVVFKPGQSSYVGPNSDESANRWGDTSATATDPLDDLSFWTIQEFAAAPTGYALGRWGTWWARIVPKSGSAERSVLVSK